MGKKGVDIEGERGCYLLQMVKYLDVGTKDSSLSLVLPWILAGISPIIVLRERY